MKKKLYLSAAEAAQLLDISLPTLYSYVSRGLVRSEDADMGKRTRRYHSEDVERLRLRKEHQRDPRKAVQDALYWGGPMLDSAITLIESGHLYYRGHDVRDLAVTRTIEQTAALIWADNEEEADALFATTPHELPSRCRSMLPLLAQCTPMERMMTLLPLAASDDLAAYDLLPGAVAQTGGRLLRQMAAMAVGVSHCGESILSILQSVWGQGDPHAARLLNMAVILCADHELNISAFTARCAASASSHPYAVVTAGLASLQGFKHGGTCERVKAFFRETTTHAQLRTALSSCVKRGETVPGFGHPLYPTDDPRGKLLLDETVAAYPYSPAVQLSLALVEEVRNSLNKSPNVEFALVTLSDAMRLPPGSAIGLYALGRSIGWIGHAIEEYQEDRMIRPRAHYTGRLPEREAAQKAVVG